MAFNDVRIQKGIHEKILMTFSNEMQTRTAPKRNNLVSATQPKEKVLKDYQRDINRPSTNLSKLLQELDYDKLVKKSDHFPKRNVRNETSVKHKDDLAVTDRHDITNQDFTDRDLSHILPPMNAKDDGDDLFAVDDHPLDLSFTQDLDYGKHGIFTGYASDNDKQDFNKQTIDDFKSSIISSDESIAGKIQMHAG